MTVDDVDIIAYDDDSIESTTKSTYYFLYQNQFDIPTCKLSVEKDDY